MIQEKQYLVFLNDKRKSLRWSCSNVVCLGAYYSVPLVLFWLSYMAMKWIRSAFLDEQSEQAERKEDSKVMRRYTPITKIGSSSTKPTFLLHEDKLVL